MSRCARCDFSADDLAEHALEAGHFLCVVCQSQSLREWERQTCATCVAVVRADLADLMQEYTLLSPDGLASLTLAGDGTMQRHPHGYELDLGIRDEWPNDPLPVLPALASWEDYLREDYKDDKGSVPATLSATVGYLTTNLDSRHNFAQTFPGFDDLAKEIARHRGAVRHVVGLADDPLEAEAECFNCGGDLLRTYEPPHGGPVRAKRQGLPWEGLTTDWTCSRCRHVYSLHSYLMGLRVVTSMWVEVPLAAKVAHRSIWTVRSWMRRLQVMTVCRVSDGAILVWWPDVSDRAFRHADEERSA